MTAPRSRPVLPRVPDDVLDAVVRQAVEPIRDVEGFYLGCRLNEDLAERLARALYGDLLEAVAPEGEREAA
jgi:hypothetical protein